MFCDDCFNKDNCEDSSKNEGCSKYVPKDVKEEWQEFLEDLNNKGFAGVY